MKANAPGRWRFRWLTDQADKLTTRLVREHNPARWLANDGLCHTAPNNLVQARMMVGAHHDRIDGMGIRPASEHLANRAAATLRGLERGVDPVFPQMIDESRPGLHDRVGLVVRHGHHADYGGCL